MTEKEVILSIVRVGDCGKLGLLCHNNFSTSHPACRELFPCIRSICEHRARSYGVEGHWEDSVNKMIQHGLENNIITEEDLLEALI